MTSLRYAIPLLATMVVPTAPSAAEPHSGCAGLDDPLALRICLIDQEIMRLGAGDCLVTEALAREAAQAGIEPVCLSGLGGAGAAPMGQPWAATGAGGIRMSTSGPLMFTAEPRVLSDDVTDDEKFVALESRQTLLQTADAGVAAGAFGADDRAALWLIPLFVVLLLGLSGGGGSGDSISPS